MTTIRETRDREKTYREKVAGYFFDISKIIFTAMVVGAVSQLFQKEYDVLFTTLVFIVGVVLTYATYRIAIIVLKS